MALIIYILNRLLSFQFVRCRYFYCFSDFFLVHSYICPVIAFTPLHLISDAINALNFYAHFLVLSFMHYSPSKFCFLMARNNNRFISSNVCNKLPRYGTHETVSAQQALKLYSIISWTARF